MFLAVPLTIAIKIACENSVKYNYIAVILTDKLIEKKFFILPKACKYLLD